MNRISQLSSTGLFDANVPRYTSYPTAPHFSDSVTSDTMVKCLNSLTPDSSVSLYVHIPFCARLCWFCACRTQGVRNSDPIDAYIETLKAEIAMVALIRKDLPKVVRLHWGGGTPTILTPAQISELSTALREAFDFDPDCEFSVEIDPTLVDQERIAALSEAGMNRASIGIQDFDPDIQSAIGRIQSFERTAEVVDMLRAAGINSLNTDILYGLPLQTLDGIEASTKKVLSLNPDRVALFGYAHVPWVAKRQRMINPDTLPDPKARLALLEQTEVQFQTEGYLPLGIDHFARPGDSLAQAAAEGRMRRNFQGYTDDGADALIGLGASSISRFEAGHVQNASATATYTGKIRSGQLSVARGYLFKLEDRIRGAFIEEFLCNLSVDLSKMDTRFGNFTEVLDPDLTRALGKFAPWLTREGDMVRLSADGKPLARLIAAEFDGFFKDGTARHSRAI
ncbi:MAG: oxygen-independent coproporphyrinogen III oxidase [Pseudomonadota bacterium]